MKIAAKVKPHPLRKHRLLYQQRWYVTEAVFLKYAKHKDDCMGHLDKCTCGLTKIIELNDKSSE